MVGDVRQPELIRAVCGELVPDATVLIGNGAMVVMDGGSQLLAVARSLLPGRTSPLVGRGDPPRGAVCHRLTRIASLIGQGPIPKLRVIWMRVE